MKRLFLFALAFFLIFTLAACSNESSAPAVDDTSVDEPSEARLRVITSIFPQYDFIRQIAGDLVELSMLISPGAEAHSFEPSPQDMIHLHDADLFVYAGGDGELWVSTIIAAVREDSDVIAVNMLDMVEGLEKSHTHSHNHAHDHNHNHTHGHSHTHDHEDEHSHDHSHEHEHEDSHDHAHDHDAPEFDEHVWTDPQNAIIVVNTLTDILSDLAPEHAATFRENADAFIRELEDLDAAFHALMAEATLHTVVFGDRFPFRYLAHAYGLSFYAAFPGCSTETEVAPQTIAHLIQTVNAYEIPFVFYLEFSNGRIADVIVEATNAERLQLHSLHNLSQADFSDGVTYLDLMWQNLANLRKALVV